MKRVFVIRHAQAVAKDLGIPDFERSLEPKGVKDSRKLGKKLAQLHMQSCVLVSSPANRALEMAHLVAKELDYPTEKVLLKESIYEAENGAAFMDTIRGLDDDCSTALLFGHEPTLSEFVHTLSGSFHHSLPKSGAIGLEFEDTNWSSIADNSGAIFYFYYPMSKEDRQKLEKRVTKEIGQEVAESLTATVARLNPDAVDKMKKAIRSAGKDVTERLLKVAGSQNLVQQYMVKMAGQETDNSPAEEEAAETQSTTTDADTVKA